MGEGLSLFKTTKESRRQQMQRVVSNIQNLGFTIMNAPVEDKKVRAGGIILDQTLVNGQSEGVSVRLINGTKKTAAVKLDKAALTDLLEAVQEVLATEQG